MRARICERCPHFLRLTELIEACAIERLGAS
jgi:hypothetical protein